MRPILEAAFQKLLQICTVELLSEMCGSSDTMITAIATIPTHIVP